MNLSKEAKKYLKSIKLMIGTPMYDAKGDTGFVLSCLAFQKIAQEIGLTIDFKFIYNESLVQRGRNTISHFFMQTNFTHLLFIDADIRFKPTDIIELLLHSKTHRGIIGANYPKKQINWKSIEYAIKSGADVSSLAHCSGHHSVNIIKEKAADVFDVTKPVEVKHVATGFMLIPRYCFEKYKAAFPQMHYKNNHIVEVEKDFQICAYFHCEINKEQIYLSEDYYFCEKMRELGEKIYALCTINLAHVGSYSFEGCFMCSLGVYVHDVKKGV